MHRLVKLFKLQKVKNETLEKEQKSMSSDTNIVVNAQSVVAVVKSLKDALKAVQDSHSAADALIADLQNQIDLANKELESVLGVGASTGGINA